MTTVPNSKHPWIFVLAAFFVALVVGCEKDDGIARYEAPKDPAGTATQAAAGQAGMGGQAGAAAPASNTLHWTAPAAWKQGAAQQMRVATFIVNDGEPPVELTVIPLGKEAGAVLANVNRWEGQLGLPASPADKLGNVVTHKKIGELEVDVVDLTAAEGASPRMRMLAAIVPHGGQIWFFKMAGPVEIVSAQKHNFDDFIGSLHPGGEGHAHPAQADAADPHAGHDHAANPHTDQPATQNTVPVSKLVKWTAPTGWKELPDSKDPRMLAFAIGSGDKTAEMVATRFAAGNAGSFMDNINRWRGQIGLPPVNDPEAAKLEDVVVGKDGQGVVVEFENPQGSPQGGRKMVVLIASAQGDLWFFKLTGPTELVTSERANFDAFTKSLEFGGDGEPTARQ